MSGLKHIGGLLLRPNVKRLPQNPWRPKPQNTVRRGERAILDVLARLMGHFSKTYVFPSQATICARLKEDYGITMSRRHLNRHLNALVARGDLTRQQREKSKKTGRWQSTMYWLRMRAVAAMKKARDALEGLLAAHRVPRPAQYPKHVLIASHLPAVKTAFSPPSTA